MKRSVVTGLFMILTCAVSVAQSHLRVPYFFGSDMVLQRRKPVSIWGSSSAKASFAVEFMGQKKKVKADRGGNWKVEFAAAEAGGPYEMKFISDSSFVFSNIMIGDVWLCSGQSNMEWKVMQSFNAPYELRSADYPDIRSFTVTRQVSTVPLTNTLPSTWQVCTPQYAAFFSAVAYFFAREIYEREKVPIGIVHTSWGGTRIEAWTGLESIAQLPGYKVIADSFRLSRNTPKSVEAKERKYNDENRVWKSNVQRIDPGYTEKWFSPEFKPAGWKTLVAPGFWEDQGLKDYDGVVWLRKEIIVPSSLAGKDLLLNLEVIDDYDITWFNGVEIGSTGWAPGRRIYAIPGNLVQAGKNLLTLRIEDNGGSGGFRSRNAADLRLQELVESDSPLIIPVSGEWLYKPALVTAQYLPKPEAPISNNHHPSSIYNAMVAPFSNLPLKGFLWYQGAGNAGHAYEYRAAMPLLIKDWRKQFQQGDLPFLFVQLAGYGALTSTPVEHSWAELREAQLMALSVPQTGMAVIVDAGNPYDVHPTNKQVVGKRLAAEARKLVYGESDLQTSPLYQSMKVEGNKVRIQFTNTATGLVANGKLKGFAIAGADKKFVWADAEIVGKEVVVWSDQVQQPVSVRYAWTGSPVESNGANLYNAEGFPASPFRTDDWDGVTKPK